MAVRPRGGSGPVLLALVLFAAGLTGCIGGEEPSDVTPASTEPADDPTNTSQPTHELVERRFVWDGNVDLTVCGWVVAEGCLYGTVLLSGLTLGLVPCDCPGYRRQVSGLASPVELTVSWDPTSPLTEELFVLGLMEVRRDQGGWEQVEVGNTTGGSPLELSLEHPPGAPRSLVLWFRTVPTVLPGVGASVDQAVRMEGSYLVLAEVLP